jgi:monoamine oxidase
MYSILSGNLQEKFIEPYARQLIALGCKIYLERRVHEFVFTGTRISEARFKVGSTESTLKGDIFVVTTPPGVTTQIVNRHLLAATPELANLSRLQSVPMASMSLYLKRPIPGLPKEHIMLADSKYALSFIDVSQTWKNSAGAVLTFNIGDLEPICSLPPDGMAECVIEELRNFIPEIHPEDIDHYHMRPNFDTPLLMNTTGTWCFRPSAGRTSIDNLYLAGDYCQSTVNVISMEGAITSGLLVAAAILESNGLSSFARILEPKKPPRLVLVALRNLLFPMMLLISYWSRARKSR